jgi:hypothetical protein
MWLYNNYPREVSRKRKIIHSFEELIAYIDRNNGYNEMVCISLYGGGWIEEGNIIYDTAIIDKLLFDFDEENNYSPIEEARKLDKFLAKYNIRRIRIFSGGGIHVIPQVEPIELKSPSAAIKNVMEFISAQARIYRDSGVGVYTAQHVRIINTYNAKRGRFCIPLTDEQFMTMGMPQLQALATKQQKLIASMIVGNNKINIKNFDEEPTYDTLTSLEVDDTEVLPQDINKNCMKIRREAGNKERFILISSLVESAFSKQAIKNHLKTVLSPNKFNHSVNIEHQVDAIFDKNLVCYSCDKIKDFGLCKDEDTCPYSDKPW